MKDAQELSGPEWSMMRKGQEIGSGLGEGCGVAGVLFQKVSEEVFPGRAVSRCCIPEGGEEVL